MSWRRCVVHKLSKSDLMSCLNQCALQDTQKVVCSAIFSSESKVNFSFYDIHRGTWNKYFLYYNYNQMKNSRKRLRYIINNSCIWNLKVTLQFVICSPYKISKWNKKYIYSYDIHSKTDTRCLRCLRLGI